MLLLASGSGLGIALDSISIVFSVVMIAVVVVALVAMKKMNGNSSEEAPPAEPVEEPVEVPAEEPVEAPAEEPVAAAEPEISVAPELAVIGVPIVTEEGIPVGDTLRCNRSFMAKLIQSSDDVKRWYSQLKNAFLSYKKTSSRISWQADSINSGRTKLGKFVIRGKTLCLYLALDPDEYAESKYKVERATEKRYESVPCLYRIKGERRAKYALELIAAVAEKYGLVPIEREEVDYWLPYESTRSLFERGLIKGDLIFADDEEGQPVSVEAVAVPEEDGEEPIEEIEELEEIEEEEEPEGEPLVAVAGPAEEPEEDEEPLEETDEEGEEDEGEEEDVPADLAAAGIPGSVIGRARYNKSFTAKLIQSSDEMKERYSQLKNAFLSYKKTSSRISWQADSINSGRTKLGKFVIRGKTLCLYLALDPDEYAESKYKLERTTHRRYESVPCMYRIKGERRTKYAFELIAAVAEKYGLVPIEREEVDYKLPYEDTPSLIARGLIKGEYIPAEGVDVQPVPAEEPVAEPVEEAVVTATEPVEEVVEEPAEEPAEEVVEEVVATEEPAEEPAEEVVEEAEPAEEPAEEAEPVEEPIEEPAEEPVEEPTEEPAEEVVEEAEPVEEPAEEVVEEPAEEPVEESAEEVVEEAEPVEEPAEEVVEEPAEEPAEEVVEEPAEEPVEEPTEEPVEEPAEEPVEEVVVAEAEPTEEPVVEEAKPVEEPAEEVVEEAEPVEEPVVEEAKPVEEPVVEEAKPVEEPAAAQPEEDDSQKKILVVGVRFKARGKKVYWFDPDGKTWKVGETALYVNGREKQEVVVEEVTMRAENLLHLPLKPLVKLH